MEKLTNHGLLKQERVYRLLRETRRSDDEHFQLLKVEMPVHGVVDLMQEARVGLHDDRVSQQTSEADEETNPLGAQGCSSAFSFPRDGYVDALLDDGCVVSDDADVGGACERSQGVLPVSAGSGEEERRKAALTFSANNRAHIRSSTRLRHLPQPFPRNTVPLPLTLDNREIAPDLQIECMVRSLLDMLVLARNLARNMQGRRTGCPGGGGDGCRGVGSGRGGCGGGIVGLGERRV